MGLDVIVPNEKMEGKKKKKVANEVITYLGQGTVA
jgi:hypothetical protein